MMSPRGVAQACPGMPEIAQNGPKSRIFDLFDKSGHFFRLESLGNNRYQVRVTFRTETLASRSHGLARTCPKGPKTGQNDPRDNLFDFFRRIDWPVSAGITSECKRHVSSIFFRKPHARERSGSRDFYLCSRSVDLVDFFRGQRSYLENGGITWADFMLKLTARYGFL